MKKVNNNGITIRDERTNTIIHTSGYGSESEEDGKLFSEIFYRNVSSCFYDSFTERLEFLKNCKNKEYKIVEVTVDKHLKELRE
jgi:hypothetical protein